jgi:segregation and condensation protein A
MPLQEDYQVTLDAFHGPLDLLLYLIRRAEVDIHDIPIAQITQQYLALLKRLDHIDVDAAGEFLVMAATLIEIKSRTLVPAEAEGEAAAIDGLAAPTGEGIDPRHELVQQLLAYQRYRIASEELQNRREAFSQRYLARAVHDGRGERTTEADEAQLELDLELEDVHILDLHDAYEHIAASINFAQMGDHTVEIDDTPIALYQEDLLDRLRRAELHRMTLQEAFRGHTLLQRVGLFLATLELVRLGNVAVKQQEPLSEIMIELLSEDSSAQENVD